MKQKLRRLALGVLFGMLALCALSLQAGAAETAFTDQALEGISLPKVLGAETFSWEGVDFHRVTIPRYVLERYETSSYEILPGQSDERVKAVKLALYSNDTYPDNEFVTYTCARARLSRVILMRTSRRFLRQSIVSAGLMKRPHASMS